LNYEKVITILDKQGRRKAGGKSPVHPNRFKRPLARRKGTNPAITFYDLGQKKVGEVYEDLPILKVPSAVVEPLNDPSDIFFDGATYTCEAFTEVDYQNMIDLLFTVPVEEWAATYRKLEYELHPDSTEAGEISAPATYPRGLAIRSPVTDTNFNVFDDFSANIETEAGRDKRLTDLTSYGFNWNKRGLEYRNLIRLLVRESALHNEHWFPLDSDNSEDFKITATYDSTAPDVSGEISFSGNIHVYMVPLIGIWAASSVRGGHVLSGGYAGSNGVEVLGPWYQAFPRSYWPYYVDPYDLTDIDLRSEAFLAYQKQRDGAVASEWTHLVGTEDITTGALDPADFRDGNNTWTSLINNFILRLYDAPGTTATTVVLPESAPEGQVFFIMEGRQLMAVLKVRGQFYYVWSVDYGDGITTVTDSVNNVSGHALQVYPPGDEPPDDL
jgi:hypothetical protein